MDLETRMKLELRPLAAGEEAALWAVFQSSVHELACADYTPAQLAAWAPRVYPGAEWEARIRRNRPWVALYGGRPAGFADLQAGGYIDQFFVAAFAAGRGVGGALMRKLEAEAAARGLTRLHAHVSLTAQPFFAHFGFVVEAAQAVTVRGATLRNARMERRLRAAG